MQTIKINPEAKKNISWILLITLLATVVLIVLDVKYYNRYADFQTVDAIISDVTRHVTKSPSSKNRIHKFYNIRIRSRRKDVYGNAKRIYQDW